MWNWERKLRCWCRIWWHSTNNSRGEVGRVPLRDLRGALYHPPHPHNRGQLQQVSRGHILHEAKTKTDSAPRPSLCHRCFVHAPAFISASNVLRLDVTVTSFVEYDIKCKSSRGSKHKSERRVTSIKYAKQAHSSCQNQPNKSQLWEIQLWRAVQPVWALTLSNLSRYYEKSVIEQEIEELRGRRRDNWIETKQSIREARYRLSLKGNESLAKATEYSTFFSDEVPNGRIPKTETVSTAMYGSLPRDDLLLEPLPPWFSFRLLHFFFLKCHRTQR